MNSRSAVNLVLLLLVVALAGLVYRQQSSTGPANHLTDLQRDTINSIVIPRSKGDIVLKKINGRWQMQSPYQLRAHEFRVERLIDLATSPVEKVYDMDTLKGKDFGLQDNATRIRFNDTLVQYGDVSPVNGKRYVRVNNRLNLIDDELYPLINSQPSSFADLYLLDNRQRIVAIDLPDLHIEKSARGHWETRPDTRADADSLQTLVDNWQSAQAFGVHAYMERKQLGEITLHLQDGSKLQLVISDTTPWLILARPQLGIEYHFDKNFNQRLLKPSESEKTSDPPDA